MTTRAIVLALALAASLIAARGPALAGDVTAPAPPTATAAPPAESPAVRRYRTRLERFREENAALDPATRNAVFVGDSITEAFPLARFLEGRRALNRGIGGDTTGAVGARGVIRRLDESVFACRPSVMFLQIGVNDLNGTETPPERIVTGVAAIVDAVRARLPDLPIVLGTVLPTAEKWKRHAALNARIEAFNAGLRALARERGLPLLDLHAAYRGDDGLLPADMTRDGLHLLPDAYAKWADLARPLLP